MSKQNHSSPQFTHVRKVRYRYVPIMETREHEEIGKYITYAISVRSVEDEVARVADVSTDFEAVRKLANLCTEQELDPDQLLDVVEDFLADESLIV